MENRKRNKLEQAKLRVLRIKSFYNHLVIFVIINGSLLLLKEEVTIALFGKEALGNPKIMNWIEWNAYVWLVILAIHAIITFGSTSPFLKKWEERQIRKYLEKDESEI